MNSFQTGKKKLKEINELMINLKNGELSLTENKIQKIMKSIPNVTYINDLVPIPEKISISDLKQQSNREAIIVGNLLKLGKIYDFEDLEYDHRQLKPVLKDASDRITREFQKFFSQENLEFEIEKQGADLVFSINGGVSVSASPKERSEGFQWLLAFFAQFALELKNGNIIFLLDEPAIHLHPRGQKDIVILLEKISQNYQIIYSTHSPFMINKNFPQRLRLLVKDPQKGTIINNKPYANSNTRCWEPLKSSLGISLGDLLSLGEINLIVEGVSDQVIISGISRKFADLGQAYIDLEKVSVVPALGATCEEALARLAVAEQLKSISLLDNDTEGKRIFKNLQKEKGLELITVDALKKEAITIEDLVPSNVYTKAVNAVYSTFKEYKQCDTVSDKSGIVHGIREHLKGLGFEDIDKVAVARELINSLQITKENSAEYTAFDQLFTIVNKIQSTPN